MASLDKIIWVQRTELPRWCPHKTASHVCVFCGGLVNNWRKQLHGSALRLYIVWTHIMKYPSGETRELEKHTPPHACLQFFYLKGFAQVIYSTLCIHCVRMVKLQMLLCFISCIATSNQSCEVIHFRADLWRNIQVPELNLLPYRFWVTLNKIKKKKMWMM